MALSKVTYVDGVTIIGAKNLNDIQDELIRQGEQQTEDEEATEAALALKADKSTTYTKTEVDSALNGKADKSTTYTKTEVDSALALKANASDVNSSLALKADKSDTYTKAQVDASLALKADKADTYTKTEVDNALASKADADDVYTKTEADALLDKKANIDGYYENMTVGNAEQLVTNLTDTESEPFTFRTAGGQLEIGDREELKVVGGSVAWNQLVQNGDFADGKTNWYGNSGFAVNSKIASFTAVSRYDGPYQVLAGTRIAGHKYYLHTKVKATTATNQIQVICQGNGTAVSVYTKETTDWQTVETINSATLDFNRVSIRDNRTSGWDSIQFTNFLLIDLTQMFGTAIADYIYSLETATAGAGVAFFKKYFPKNYYPYNAGELLHVQTSEFKTVGFNLFDKETMLVNGKYINDNSGSEQGNANSSCTDFIPVIPNATYFIETEQISGAWGAWYDAEKNFVAKCIGYYKNSGFQAQTAPSNAHYLRLTIKYPNNNGNADTFCVSLRWDGTRDGEYEPYTEHSYPLDDSLTLRGIPKLDADNNLYFDGDTYEHDGTVTRRYGVVDLGTLDWNYNSSQSRFTTSLVGLKVPVNNNTQANIICSKYPTVSTNDNITTDKTVGLSIYGALGIHDTSFGADVTAFKSAMDGESIVCELATPTTESAEPYQTPQIVDNWGTEEFVVPTQSGIEIPVGHETVYPISLRDKLESAPNLPDGDGDYLLHMASGEATYKQLVSEFPSAPTTDGTYVLKATVSDGTATLTWVAE